MGKQALNHFRECIPIFQLLTDPHRQDILLLLSEHDFLSVNDITEHSTLSRPAVSHHLKLLREQGLIKVEQRGTERYYSLSLEPAVKLLKEFLLSVERDCL
ncbi:metalloregulator ArsR/SmtB family transcription factor [Bacillus sp. GM_Baccil_2]|uniref:ArsR/SmtB family transcription factor n=1 Tax=Bacillus sp. GM_Baccil_2 TaxID=2937369 RepID=UPI00226A3269